MKLDSFLADSAMDPSVLRHKLPDLVKVPFTAANRSVGGVSPQGDFSRSLHNLIYRRPRFTVGYSRISKLSDVPALRTTDVRGAG